MAKTAKRIERRRQQIPSREISDGFRTRTREERLRSLAVAKCSLVALHELARLPGQPPPAQPPKTDQAGAEAEQDVVDMELHIADIAEGAGTIADKLLVVGSGHDLPRFLDSGGGVLV